MSPRTPLVVLCIVFAMAATGCSTLVPGLNIDEGSKGTHEYRIVSEKEGTGYEIAPAQPQPAYQVVAITPQVIVDIAQNQAAAAEQDGDGLSALLPSDVPPDYRLGPGDIFFPIVWEHPELTQPFSGGAGAEATAQGRLIASDGTAFFPYVGTFPAAGKTVSELRAFLTDKLSAVILKPQVDVRVVLYRANRVEVTGEVLKPSTITLDDTPKGVLQAIDACGGLTPLASRRQAVLVRHGKKRLIDLGGLLSGGRMVPNPALEPGDVLHIPDQSGDQVFMLGAVNKSQPVAMQQGSLSLVQALTTAGGLDSVRANQSGVLVFRLHRTGSKAPAAAPQTDSTPGDASGLEATIFTLDMSRPEAMLLASEFELQPRDVVYVKSTGFAKYNSVVNELLPTVTQLFYLLEIHNLTK